MSRPVVEVLVSASGAKLKVIRRRSMRHDTHIMRALEYAGAFVIGQPGNFRYRWDGAKNFTTPSPSDVFVLDAEGAVNSIYSSEYVDRFYREALT